MKVASHKTINNSKTTRIAYAYNALERDSMLGLDDAEAIDNAFTEFLAGNMSRADQLEWAFREREYRMCTDDSQ